MQVPGGIPLQQLVARGTLGLAEAVQVLRQLVPLVGPDTIIYPSTIGISSSEPFTVALEHFPAAAGEQPLQRGFGRALPQLLALLASGSTSTLKLAKMGGVSVWAVVMLLQEHCKTSDVPECKRVGQFCRQCLRLPAEDAQGMAEWREEMLSFL